MRIIWHTDTASIAYQQRIDDICTWVRANGGDPHVWIDADIINTGSPDAPVMFIRATVPVVDGHGHKVIDWDTSTVMTRHEWLPLLTAMPFADADGAA